MKKIILCITALLIAFSVHAQQRFEYGFRVGGGLSTQSVHSSAAVSTNAIRTFDAFLIGKMAIKNNYYIQVGLGIVDKGATKFEDALTTTSHITYFEIPVDIIHKFNVPTLGKFLVGAGGYYATASNGTFNYETPNSANSDTIAFGNDNDLAKSDAGFNLITGLELNNRLTFNIGYDFGLTNIASQPLKDTGTSSVYNRSVMVSLGLTF